MLEVCTFEERVILAAQFGRKRAINYLLCKWETPKNKLVTALASSYGLSQHDAADARQEAVLWLVAAIQKYQFAGTAEFRERRMKAFLRTTLTRRMSNFVRRLQRKSRLTDACVDTEADLCQTLARRVASVSLSLDPARRCEQTDELDVVHQAIRTVGSHGERFCDALQSGHTLHEAAQGLGISYHQARRLRKRVARKLALFGKPR